MLTFRNLRADEIEVRPTDTKYKGKATLLLYKDARTDRRILDETVGPENWQCEFYEVNGATFCRVGILTDRGEWVWKSDCGSESNIEADKGLASDAFKRACFKWSIGAELYAIPRIKIKCPEDYYINDRFCMSFRVSKFKAEGEQVLELEIVDRFGEVVYTLGSEAKRSGAIRRTEAKAETESPDYLQKLTDFCHTLKKDESIDKDHLTGFYYLYKDRIEKNGFEPKSFSALWKKYEESPIRKQEDAERAKRTKLSDNE